MRITKASFTERRAYNSANDLYGHVRIGHHQCLIEYDGTVLRGATALIVAAPAGLCFHPGNTPTARFDSLPVLQVLLKELSLRPAA
jgi:hypothetical protein